ncbi:hypothetical protein VZT92_012554 [Zoarces viviparus]|uniref:Uncharacterized protein n=1 Tax=Zoarces viviparus TaxID=48416 RepID=A0AAW1F2F2_ZOAVI
MRMSSGTLCTSLTACCGLSLTSRGCSHGPGKHPGEAPPHSSGIALRGDHQGLPGAGGLYRQVRRYLADTAARVQQRLLQTHQDFESRFRIWALCTCRTHSSPTQARRLRASLDIKLPVMINRLKSRVTSNTVHLHWEVAGEQSQDLNQDFEIHIKSLHPTTAEHGVTKSTCQS